MKFQFTMVNDIFMPYVDSLSNMVLTAKYVSEGYTIELECVGSYDIDPSLDPIAYTTKGITDWEGRFKHVDPSIPVECYTKSKYDIEADELKNNQWIHSGIGTIDAQKAIRYYIDIVRCHLTSIPTFFNLYDNNKIIIKGNEQHDVACFKHLIGSLRPLLKEYCPQNTLNVFADNAKNSTSSNIKSNMEIKIPKLGGN